MKHHLLILTLLWTGALGAQAPFDELQKVDPSTEDVGPSPLQAFLDLSEHQVYNLEQLNRELQEAIVPLFFEIWQVQWKLFQMTRDEDASAEEVLETFFGTLVDLSNQIQDARSAHRVKVLVLLHAEQRLGLAELQEAIELLPAAREAVCSNLVEPPAFGLETACLPELGIPFFPGSLLGPQLGSPLTALESVSASLPGPH